MTEVEKLARMVRLALLGAVGVLVVGLIFVGGRAGVRWGVDLATTSRSEKVDQCVKAVQDLQMREGSRLQIGAFGGISYCSKADGDIEKARAAIDAARK